MSYQSNDNVTAVSFSSSKAEYELLSTERPQSAHGFLDLVMDKLLAKASNVTIKVSGLRDQ